jgi:hypothetical protein
MFAVLLYGIVAIVVLAFAVRYLVRFLQWVERSEIARQKAEAETERKRKTAAAAKAEAASAPADGVPADHVAAIAAAVATFGYRVVHIADGASGHAWASEGRWMHQTSHRTH